MNLAAPLHRHARDAGDRLAVAQGERRLTYARLSERVARLAGALSALGLEPGDRVGGSSGDSGRRWGRLVRSSLISPP